MVSLALLGILLLGLGLRLWGCFGQGYPHCYYPDESNNVERALKFGAEKTLDPGWFHKPALGYYVLFAEYAAWYGVGRLFGTFDGPEDFGIRYFHDPGPFLLIGRIGTTLFGVFTLLLVFRLGRAIDGELTGLLAALALALTLGHVASSQQVKMDVPAAFWNTWCVLLLFGVMTRGRWRDYIGCGVVAGLGMATKYYPIVMLFPMVCAHFFREPSAVSRSPRYMLSPRLGGCVLAFFAAFFVGSPYNYLSGWWSDRFWNQLAWVLRRLGIHLGQALDGAKEGSSLITSHSLLESYDRLLQNFADPSGAGWPLALLALAGAVAVAVRPSRKALLLAITALVCILFIGVANRQITSPRHLNVLYPLTAVLAALGAVGVVRLLMRRAPDKLRLRIAAIGFVSVCIFPLIEVIAHDREANESDPRNEAVAWIERNVPSGSVIVNDHGRIPLMASRERCAWAMERLRHLERRFLVGIDRVKARSDRDTPGDVRWLENQISKTATYRTQWRYRLAAVDQATGPTYDVIDFLHTWQTEDLARRVSSSAAYNPLWPRSPWGERLQAILGDLERDDLAEDLSKPELRAEVVERMRAFLVQRFLVVAVNRTRRTIERSGRSLETLDQLEAEVGEALQVLWEDRGGRWPDRMPSPVELWRESSAVSGPWLTRVSKDGGRALPRGVEFFVSAKATYGNYQKPWKRENFPDWAAFYDDLLANYDSQVFNEGDPDPFRVIRVFDLRKRKPR